MQMDRSSRKVIRLLVSLAMVSSLPGCDDAARTPGDGGVAARPLEVITVEMCERPEEDLFPSPACVGVPRPTDLSTVDPETLAAELVGRWTQCLDGTGVVSDPPVAGIEFDEAGRWAYLVEDGGQIVASELEGYHGLFEVREAATIQLYDVDGISGLGGGVIRLGCGPHQLATLGALWARGPGSGQRFVFPDATAAAYPLGDCDEVGSPTMLPDDREQAMALLAGTWRICFGSLPSSLFMPPTETDFGVELAASGDWWRLTEEDGRIVRGGHVGDVGSWVLKRDGDHWSMHFDAFPEIGLLDRTGDFSGPIVLGEDPRQLRWTWTLTETVVLVGPRR
ncbi:MAG: hypothetical protein R3F60_25625 [bacterium]